MYTIDKRSYQDLQKVPDVVMSRSPALVLGRRSRGTRPLSSFCPRTAGLSCPPSGGAWKTGVRSPGPPLVSRPCLSSRGDSLASTPRCASREKPPHPGGGRAGVSRRRRSRRRRAACPPQCVGASRPALSGDLAALRVAPHWPELWRRFPLPARPSGPHRDGASVEQLSRDVERVREARLSPSRGAGASSWSSSPRAGGTDVAGRAPCVSLGCTRACEPSWRAWRREAGSVRHFRSSPRPRHGPATPTPRPAPPRQTEEPDAAQAFHCLDGEGARQTSCGPYRRSAAQPRASLSKSLRGSKGETMVGDDAPSGRKPLLAIGEDLGVPDPPVSTPPKPAVLQPVCRVSHSRVRGAPYFFLS